MCSETTAVQGLSPAGPEEASHREFHKNAADGRRRQAEDPKSQPGLPLWLRVTAAVGDPGQRAPGLLTHRELINVSRLNPLPL